MRLLTTVHRITEANEYILPGRTAVCGYNKFGSCPLPSSVPLYTIWETNSTYDLSVIVANETLP